MKVLNQVEMQEVSGAGFLADVVNDIKNSDFVGAYEHVVDATSHVIERVANAIK